MKFSCSGCCVKPRSRFGRKFNALKKSLLAFLSVAIIGCNGGTEDTETQNTDSTMTTSALTDLKVEIIAEGSGPKPANGDMVVVHYTGRLATTGKVFDSSVDRGEPIEFQLGIGQVIKGWDKGIAQLNVGTKAVLHIPAHLAYGQRQTGPIPPGSDLIFDVELIEVKPAPKAWSVDGVEPITTPSGLKYFVVEKGSGKPAKAGAEVDVHYTGFLLADGRKFDSSLDRNEFFTFTLGASEVIAGWDEGVALMREGDKFQFHIPFSLAYGEQGYPGAIPPKADLVFDVELVKVH